MTKTEETKTKRAAFIFKAWRRFKKNPLVLVGLFIISIIFFMAIAGSVISPFNPDQIIFSDIYDPPSSKHLLGADQLGRDVLSRVIAGARSSILVGVVAVMISTTIGISIGAIAGYYGGRASMILMRFTDIVMTVPSLFFTIIMISVFKVQGLGVIMMVIGLLGWPGIARVVRSEVMSAKERAYIEASRSMGERDMIILFKEIVPNVITPISIMATMRMGRSILTESSLSFLGLGDPRVITWGRMLVEGQSVLTTAWWIAIYPGFMIFLTVLAFNLLGDGLRDALDVKM